MAIVKRESGVTCLLARNTLELAERYSRSNSGLRGICAVRLVHAIFGTAGCMSMTDVALKELFPRLSERNLPHLDILHYLLFEERGNHIAHCLDLDLVEVAPSQREAAAKLDRLVKAHIELALASGELANLQTSAPQAFWKRFLDGQRVNLEPATVRIQIPESVQVVPLSESELPILAHAA